MTLSPTMITHSPDTSQTLRELVADASSSATGLRIVGGGTWLDAGRHVNAQAAVSTAKLCGVVEYVPGDFVMTVGAGTTLAELTAITAPHDQWLALEPYVSTQGLTQATIGATIATASHGPLAGSYGRPRDLILGLSCITGDGAAVTVGGRVVKNVAGFDLVRLMTGAFGTLGILSQVSLRLHARPVVDESFAVVLDIPPRGEQRDVALTGLVEALNSAPLLAVTSSLASLVIVAHELPTVLHAQHDTPKGSMLLLARATGNSARVSAQRVALATFGELRAVPNDVWSTVRTMDSGNVCFRLSDAPLQSVRTLKTVEQWIEMHNVRDTRTLIEPLRGVLRISCQAHALAATGTAPPKRLPERAIAERLPNTWWAHAPVVGADDISQQLRQRFDPAGVLNPGIMGTAHRDESTTMLATT